jgi:SAM-dependent methyltransferase
MKPKEYLDGQYLDNDHWKLTARSEVIVSYFQKYAKPEDTILELGCSSGRNLKFLKDAGFKNVQGFEMSPKAVKIGRELGHDIIEGRYEDTEHAEYDIIFSASFLQEFSDFPTEQFKKTLEKTRKYFMIFGDARLEHLIHPGFTAVEKLAVPPFTQDVWVFKRNE